MTERKKRKDDTWTKEELSSALKPKDERRDRKEKSKANQDAAHSSSDRRRLERKSSGTSRTSDRDRKAKDSKDGRRTRYREDEELERELRKLEREEEKKREKEEKKLEKRESRKTEEEVDKKQEKEERRREKEERRIHKEESRHTREEKHHDKDERRREKDERRAQRAESKYSRDERHLEKEERRREREERKSPKEERKHSHEEKDREKEERRREREERRIQKEESKHSHEEREREKEERRREREERRLQKEESKHSRDERRSAEKERRGEKSDHRDLRAEKEKKRDRYEKRQTQDSKTLEREEHRREKEDKRKERDDRRQEKEDRRKRRDEKLESDQERKRSGRDKRESSKTSVKEPSSSKDSHRRGKEKLDKPKARHRESKDSEVAMEVSSASNMNLDQHEGASKSAVVMGAYNYDDEEFEDYEDDFEEEDIIDEPQEQSHEVRDIIKAMRQENERVQSARTHSAMSDERPYLQPESPMPERELSPSPLLGMTRVNFVKSKKGAQSKRVSKKVLKRRNDLINLIQLDVISFDLFDLAPVTEYNFYIKNFGSKNTRQISTQCNDDALEADTQTESPDSVEKWTQHPQDGALVCGGSQIDPHLSSAETLLSLMREGSQRYGSFLDYAGNLVESSFAEERYWSGSDKEGSILSCCESCTKFNTNLSYLQGRQILHTVFGEGGMMAISFGISNHHVAARLDSKGLITVWKESNTEQPDKILVCNALPVACCFAPKKKNLLFVGSDDGSVLVYDLSESSTMHQNREIEKNKMSVLRSPTYITGWQNDIHSSPIVCINLVGTLLSSNQIFSLDESARLCIWTVVDILSNLEDDMGVAPLGRIKLVKTKPIDVSSKKGSSNQELGNRATCAVCPDASVFYVGMESGSVVSVSRERKLKCYRSHSMGDVTSISVSNLNMMLMLVSYNDGTLALFQVKQESPLMTWSLNDCVLYSDWSNCRSSVFFALDSTNHLHVWDLMAMDSGPVVSDLLQKKTLRFCVDGYARKSTDLMVAYDQCSFEVHRISSHFTDSVTSDESDHMVSLLMSYG